MVDYRITQAQRDYLDSLECQRVADHPENKACIGKFTNVVNEGIAQSLRACWNTDTQDKVAYYIVKDPDPELDMPLFFFSVKCGEVHIPLVPEKLDDAVKSALMRLKTTVQKCGSAMMPDLPDPKGRSMRYRFYMAKYSLGLTRDVEPDDWAIDVADKQWEDGGLTAEEWVQLWDRVFTALEKQDSYREELKLEGDNIIRTRKSYPGVELMHFCAYDPIGNPFNLEGEELKKFREEHNPVLAKWHEMGMDNQSLGTAVFWNFVVPKIREIRDLVGCQYLYLFAADREREGSLTGYYKKLGFEFRDDLYVTKSAYDFQCFFMCQEVKHLRNRRNAFFRDYNKPKEPKKTEEPAKV